MPTADRHERLVHAHEPHVKFEEEHAREAHIHDHAHPTDSEHSR
jgi:hypothetical protein